MKATEVWHNLQWERLIPSALMHASDMHLYFNMVSFLYKVSDVAVGLRCVPSCATFLFCALLPAYLKRFSLARSSNTCQSYGFYAPCLVTE